MGPCRCEGGVAICFSLLANTNLTNNTESAVMIVYGEESYKIIGAAFEVYNKLGHGFLEAVYQECFEMELKKIGIPYEREK